VAVAVYTLNESVNYSLQGMVNNCQQYRIEQLTSLARLYKSKEIRDTSKHYRSVSSSSSSSGNTVY
jgi:hypothetical protein